MSQTSFFAAGAFSSSIVVQRLGGCKVGGFVAPEKLRGYVASDIVPRFRSQSFIILSCGLRKLNAVFRYYGDAVAPIPPSPLTAMSHLLRCGRAAAYMASPSTGGLGEARNPAVGRISFQG